MTTIPPNMSWTPSPHYYRNRRGIVPDTIVMHYDVVRTTAQATARIFQAKSVERSAHFCVDRRGPIVQCVDLDDAAWHAGDGGHSRMPSAEQIDAAIADGSLFVPIGEVPRTPKLMNCRSTGIEQGNMGWATRGPNGYARARHRNPACRSDAWEIWTDEQIDAAVRLCQMIISLRPSHRFITGHEDLTHADTLGDITATPDVERVSGGKTDPGPLFPWAPFEALGLVRVKYDFQRKGWSAEP